MSVINKMLRDLDSRQAVTGRAGDASQLRSSIARDTVLLNGAGSHLPGRAWLPRGVLVATTGIALIAAGVWWYLQPVPPVASPAKATALPAAPTARTQVAAVVPAVVPAAAPAVVPAAAPAPARNAASVTAAVPVSPLAPLAAPASAPVTAPIAPAARPPVTASARVALPEFALKIDSTLRAVPKAAKAVQQQAQEPAVRAGAEAVLPRTVSTPPASVAPATPAPGSLRQSAAQEVLAQAQGLWNAGSHEAALDLVREALSVAERTPAGNQQVLASLARELARMELAQGRVLQALDMLTRLEPSLSGVADVWALRGNAAQRLGRHAEAATAYQNALKLRPMEPRWMLGAAVSLAAQGQTEAATDLAEKARAAGVVSPEVAAYLRQLGVTLRER